MTEIPALLPDWIRENADTGILLAVLGVIVLAMTKGARSRRKGPGGDVGGVHLGGAHHTGGRCSGDSSGDGGGADGGGE